MIASIKGLGPARIANDRPTQAWLDDWQRLTHAREQYADGLGAGAKKPWAIPIEDGASITARMDTVGMCTVPSDLLPDH